MSTKMETGNKLGLLVYRLVTAVYCQEYDLL